MKFEPLNIELARRATAEQVARSKREKEQRTSRRRRFIVTVRKGTAV